MIRVSGSSRDPVPPARITPFIRSLRSLHGGNSRFPPWAPLPKSPLPPELPERPRPPCRSRRRCRLHPSALARDLAERTPLRVRRALGQPRLRVRAAQRRLHRLRRARGARAGRRSPRSSAGRRASRRPASPSRAPRPPGAGTATAAASCAGGPVWSAVVTSGSIRDPGAEKTTLSAPRPIRSPWRSGTFAPGLDPRAVQERPVEAPAVLEEPAVALLGDDARGDG